MLKDCCRDSVDARVFRGGLVWHVRDCRPFGQAVRDGGSASILLLYVLVAGIATINTSIDGV